MLKCISFLPALLCFLILSYELLLSKPNIVQTYIYVQKEWIHFQGRQLLQKKYYFLLPSEKGSTLKGKNLLPVGANSFL